MTTTSTGRTISLAVKLDWPNMPGQYVAFRQAMRSQLVGVEPVLVPLAHLDLVVHSDWLTGNPRIAHVWTRAIYLLRNCGLLSPATDVYCTGCRIYGFWGRRTDTNPPAPCSFFTLTEEA